MSTTSHIPERCGRRLAVVIAAAAALATAAPTDASYGKPAELFHQQHAVRAHVGDPPIAGHHAHAAHACPPAC